MAPEHCVLLQNGEIVKWRGLQCHMSRYGESSEGRADLALVTSDSTVLLKVVTNGTIIMMMPPVPLPNRACSREQPQAITAQHPELFCNALHGHFLPSAQV
jgi:hypothetical protein